MKIKLNNKQIENIRRELKEIDRRNYKTEDVAEVFKMLQYWAKSATAGDAKIKSVTELPDGYLCRVNSKFRESMKAYLKKARQHRFEEGARTKKEREMQENAERYEQLIEEAERTRMRVGHDD